MILAGTWDELSSGQAKVDTQIQTHPETGDDNTRRPKGPQVKMDLGPIKNIQNHIKYGLLLG